MARSEIARQKPAGSEARPKAICWQLQPGVAELALGLPCSTGSGVHTALRLARIFGTSTARFNSPSRGLVFTILTSRQRSINGPAPACTSLLLLRSPVRSPVLPKTCRIHHHFENMLRWQRPTT